MRRRREQISNLRTEPSVAHIEEGNVDIFDSEIRGIIINY
jgi:hypothetical protein